MYSSERAQLLAQTPRLLQLECLSRRFGEKLHYQQRQGCLKSTKHLKNKGLSVADLVISHNTDIAALTETWLCTCTDGYILSASLSPGCDVLHVARSDRRDSDLTVLFKERLSVELFHSSRA